MTNPTDQSFEMNDIIFQGIDWPIILTFYESDDVTPMDLEGALISFTVKPAYDDDDTDAAAYIALNTSDWVIDEDPDSTVPGVKNRISTVVPRAIVQTIPVGEHVQDLDIIPLATGYLNTYGSGYLEVKAQVGRRTPS